MKLLLFILGALALLALGLAWFTWRTSARIVQYLPAKGRFVDVPGGRLHVRESGDPGSPAVLLVHGLGGQMSHFDYGLAERLAQSFRVVVVDRPGSGWSTTTAGADLSTQAGALAALVERLALGRPLVVGHSLGGAVALALALEHPGKVAGLALLAPLTHMPEGERVPDVFKGLMIRPALLRKLVAWTLATPRSIAKSKQTLDQVFGPDPVPKDFGMRGGGLLTLRPAAYLAASNDLQALPARLPLQQQRYGELRLPLGILFGRDDRILDWCHNGQALADKAGGARLELIDGGHMLPVTKPEACVAFIEQMAQASGLVGGSAQQALGAL